MNTNTINTRILTILACTALFTSLGCKSNEPAPDKSNPTEQPTTQPATTSATPTDTRPASTTTPPGVPSTAASLRTHQTTQGPLMIEPLQHGTFYMTWNKKVIYIDPTKAALDGTGKASTLPKADLILITDIHGDHLDPEGAKMVMTPTTLLITAKAVADKAGAALKPTKLLANSESTKVFEDSVQITATPMYNLKRKNDQGELFHVKGRGNGYLLEMGGKRVYISGDTACTPEMRALTNIDVAFVTMNLPYTMPVEEAAECIRAFKPKNIYPFHYRGQDPTKLTTLLKGTDTIVQLLEWYPKAPEKTEDK